MKPSIWFGILVGIFAAVVGTAAHAQTTAGAGTVIVIPLVSHSASFKAEIFVRNPGATTLTLNVRFYDALFPPAPGLRPCTQFVVPPFQALSFTLDTQCTFNPANSHFGMLILEDSSTPKISTFLAFARVQNPSGIGFSDEGFPIGNFSGAGATVLGLKRQAAAPGYGSNCFVGALGEAVDYQIILRDGPTQAVLGAPITGSLVPYQSIRFIDIFAAAGASAGDHVNASANFGVTTVGAPALVGFCTVQENNTFGADFRVAKSQAAFDLRQLRLVCYGQSGFACGTLDNTVFVSDPATKNVHLFLIEQPDYVQCQLVGPNIGDLQMRVRGPGSVFSSPVWPSAPPFSSGGAGLTSFYIFTGERSTFASGYTARWFIDVGARAGATPADFPVAYGITCNSGNGVSVPYTRGTAALDF